MFFPTSFNNIECQPVTCEIVNSSEALLQRLAHCQEVGFSGHLSLTLTETHAHTWSLYFFNGWMVGGLGGNHEIRRWCRQVVRHCPQLQLPLPSRSVNLSQVWGYPALMRQVEQGRLSQNQVASAIRDSLVEVLFDLIQTHQASSRAGSESASRIQMAYHDFCQTISASPPILVPPTQVVKMAMQAWNAWIQAGLAPYSPDLAPVILDSVALQGKTPPAAYRSLNQLIDGNSTLRDLAVKLKQPLPLLTRSLLPFVRQEVIGLQAVPDIAAPPDPAEVPSPRPMRLHPKGPLVAYIEDSRFDCLAMETILEKTEHRYISIHDPIQALPMLLEHKPDIIFLDVLMPMINGYEVCAQIRQISAFKDTPIVIVTSSDGIVDRVRANLVGASGFLAKPITTEKVLVTLKTYLSASSYSPTSQSCDLIKPNIRTPKLGARSCT